MKILVVGGAGMIGGDAALHLQEKGHDVTIAGRNAPEGGSVLAALPFLKGDYIANSFDKADLAKFDAMVFAAGNDIRHLPKDVGDQHWHDANSVGIPRFFEAAKAAGIGTAVNIGSFYPQAAPQLVATNAYVRSRKESDEGAVALSGPGFRAMSVNAPFVTGTAWGIMVPMFQAYTQYAQGHFAPMPEFTPPGGVNFISTRSLSEAVEGALERGTAGTSYLVGDENLSFHDYFGAFFKAVGRPQPPVIDQEHPMLPDSAIFIGRGNNLFYEPDPTEAKLLGYRRNDIIPMIEAIVAQYRT